MSTAGSTSARVLALVLILGAVVIGGVAVWTWARVARTPAKTVVTQLGSEVALTWTEIDGAGPGGAWGLKGQTSWGPPAAATWNTVHLATAATENRSGNPILEWSVRAMVAQVTDPANAAFRLICAGSCRENGFEIRPSYQPETQRLDLTVVEVYPPAAPRSTTLSFRWKDGRFEPWPSKVDAAEPK
ncbi:MAG: hypothetical protein AAF488_03185 [Planctomycetota bacterium]